MIPASKYDCTAEPKWQRTLSDAVRNLDELAELLRIPVESLRAWADAESDFPLLVPRGLVARMRPGDLQDPLLLQVLPRRAERARAPGFVDDPLAELDIGAAGVLQKYPGRALLIASEACPLHCRYCFRREFPYSEQLASRQDWRQALDELLARGDVSEVILSGGDPLSLSTRRLETLITALERIPRIERLRIHTRFPIAIPERIDTELVELLARTSLSVVVVVHCNHPRELDATVAQALRRLRKHTALMLNQAVLLRDINDDPEILAALSRRLFDCEVQPYYLHLLDRVSGTHHFEVPEREARSIVAELRRQLPGYLMPQLVREIPGELSKTPV